MADARYDCIVIGSGPGGYVAAIRASQLGMKTAVVERDQVGGRCLNYACIPAKAVLRSADLLGEIRESSDFGLNVGSVTVDYSAVQGRRAQVVSTLTGGVGGLFRKNGIDLIEGEAALAPRADGEAPPTDGEAPRADGEAPPTDGEGSRAGDGVRVLVSGDVFFATVAILAAGSVPRPLPDLRFEGRVIGTEEAWALPELPARLAVVGAGASGAEIASGFARLGSEVLLLEMLDRVLPSEDADISRLVERGLKRQGVSIHTATAIADVHNEDGHVRFSFGDETTSVDYLVIAAGRGPDVDALGLAAAGVELDDAGLVKVDGAQRTTAAGVYAIGDLVRGPALAHKASDEGIIAAEDAAGLATHPLSYVDIPRATFCTPNVGSFGLTEQQARDAGHDVGVGKVPYGAVGGGTVYGDRAGLVKLVGDRAYGELLGGHIVGSRATELIQELVNLRALEGGYPELARIVHGHPTLSEAVMEAGRAADGWLIHG
jgi:dihydrolipoamide dehydrogenase